MKHLDLSEDEWRTLREMDVFHPHLTMHRSAKAQPNGISRS
jgi:hypothetical protein